MLFLYRFHLFAVLLSNAKRYFFGIIFILSYVFCFSYIFAALNEGFWVISSGKVNPKGIFIYTYKKLQWCYYNTDSITYVIAGKLLLAFIVPIFVYSHLSSINWLKMFRFIYDKSFKNTSKNETGNNKTNAILLHEFTAMKTEILTEVNDRIDKKYLEFEIQIRDFLENFLKNYKRTDNDTNTK